MPQVQATAQIKATPEEIFDFISDYSTILRLQPQFESARLLTEQARGQGAVVELKGRFHGIPMTVRNRIITFAPPHRLVSISEGMVLSRNSWTLRPLDNADGPLTEATLSVEYKMGGPVGGVFRGIASSLFHNEIQSMTDEMPRRLRDIFAHSREK
jgi:ribosome-associated toxin RatA of RatAB toxin-antitoxin module